MDIFVDYLYTMDYTSLGLITMPMVAVMLCGFFIIGKSKNDTMQRNSTSSNGQNNKFSSHAATTQQNTLKQQTFYQQNKNDSFETGGASMGNRQYHQQQQQQPNAGAGKQRRSRGHGKRHEVVGQNAAATLHTTRQQTQTQATQPQPPPAQQPKRSSIFAVDEWLGRNMLYCYERHFGGGSSSSEGSSAEPSTDVPKTNDTKESQLADTVNGLRHNQAHRNSTSSEAAGSEDFNSSSSNEDMTMNSKSSQKKSTAGKSRPKRQQRRQQKQQNNNGNNNNNSNNHDDETGKENQRRGSNASNKSNVAAAQQQQYNNSNNKQAGNNNNLRKQCTKAAAMRAQNGNNKQQSSNAQKAQNGNGNNTATTTAAGKAQSNNKGKQNANNTNNGSNNNGGGSNLYAASSSTSLSSAISSTSSSPIGSPKNSPTASPTAYKRAMPYYMRRNPQRPPRPCVLDHVFVDEQEFIEQMRRFIIDPDLLHIYGYPVESTSELGAFEVFKCLPRHLVEADSQEHAMLVAGMPRRQNVINVIDGLHWQAPARARHFNSVSDSGRSSGDSSPNSVDSDSSENGEDPHDTTRVIYTPDGHYQIISKYNDAINKQCVRCHTNFKVTPQGDYITRDPCLYHWGRLGPDFEDREMGAWKYSCCKGAERSTGCASHAFHVWTGASGGLNGPFHDFVHTPAPSMDSQQRLFALDCEMSYTGRGLEVTKVTLVAYDGTMVYETFVKPQAEIVDYNTRYSGITEQDLCMHSNGGGVKTLEEVQQDLLQYIDADTILLGHGLDNDLRALRIAHKTVVDTSIAFPHALGFPFRRALRHLMKVLLNRDVQTSDKGHSSYEDSRACLELMMWKLRRELSIDFFD